MKWLEDRIYEFNSSATDIADGELRAFFVRDREHPGSNAVRLSRNVLSRGSFANRMTHCPMLCARVGPETRRLVEA